MKFPFEFKHHKKLLLMAERDFDRIYWADGGIENDRYGHHRCLRDRKCFELLKHEISFVLDAHFLGEGEMKSLFKVNRRRKNRWRKVLLMSEPETIDMYHMAHDDLLFKQYWQTGFQNINCAGYKINRFKQESDQLLYRNLYKQL